MKENSFPTRVCLVTCYGSGVAVATIKALRRIDALIVWCDIDSMNAGRFLVDIFERSCRADDPRFSSQMRRMCRAHRVKFVFPVLDCELEEWAAATFRSSLASKGTMVFVNNIDTIRMCPNKLETWSRCVAGGIAHPQTWPSYVSLPTQSAFPTIGKPVSGIGAIGVQVLHDAQGLVSYHKQHPDATYQEFVHDTEFTVDVVCDCRGSFGGSIEE